MKQVGYKRATSLRLPGRTERNRCAQTRQRLRSHGICYASKLELELELELEAIAMTMCILALRSLLEPSDGLAPARGHSRA